MHKTVHQKMEAKVVIVLAVIVGAVGKFTYVKQQMLLQRLYCILVNNTSLTFPKDVIIIYFLYQEEHWSHTYLPDYYIKNAT